jgi:hypothetical protein
MFGALVARPCFHQAAPRTADPRCENFGPVTQPTPNHLRVRIQSRDEVAFGFFTSSSFTSCCTLGTAIFSACSRFDCELTSPVSLTPPFLTVVFHALVKFATDESGVQVFLDGLVEIGNYRLGTTFVTGRSHRNLIGGNLSLCLRFSDGPGLRLIRIVRILSAKGDYPGVGWRSSRSGGRTGLQSRRNNPLTRPLATLSPTGERGRGDGNPLAAGLKPRASAPAARSGESGIRHARRFALE